MSILRALRSWSAAIAIAMAVVTTGVVALETPHADAQTSRSRAHRRSRARRPRLTPAQRRQIQRWHRRATAAQVRTWSRLTPPPLVFLPLGGAPRITLVPEGDEGGFDADDLVLAQQALATRDGAMRDIHPRLIELVYRAVRQFRAPYVHVISGYRDGSATSRHGQGRALDFVLPGVSDRRLAAWLRPQGFVGVGIYPTSGFVHLDVRSRSYFWSDASGPGQRNRERRMLASASARYDAAARRRGVEPTADVEASGEDGGEESEVASDAAEAPGAETPDTSPAASGARGG